jgi:acetyl esterase/lipase
MDLKKRIDPELAPVLDMMPVDEEGLNFDNLPKRREMADKMFAEMAANMPPVEGVDTEDSDVPGPQGDPDVRVRIYKPKNRSGLLPGLLWIHGGGYIMGNYTLDDYSAKKMCVDTNCIIVSVDYRLAPEYPFPAAIEDCYAALKWTADKSVQLGIDKQRIGIGGGSAGGGLAAGLALITRDRHEIDIVFQLLIYPMIDDRNITPSSHAIDDPRAWDREKNLFAWKTYLGESAKDGEVSPYAAASRAKDLSGLPPAFIGVGELDLFVDENIEYAQRLIQAGVSTELHVYPGATHGFDSMENASVAKRFTAERNKAIIKALS